MTLRVVLRGSTTRVDRKVAEHRLPIKEGYKPIIQSPMCMSPVVIGMVKEEIEKLLKANLIRPTRYVEWLANIVLVIKKNGKIRVCIDFGDLNNATPKDEYPMPVADLLVDATAGYRYLSFMDGYAGYYQLAIAKTDCHKTTFRCLGTIGTFEWTSMPFGLKNVRVTYQRTMNYVFHDMTGRSMEIYIDDVVVKSQER